jgi:hypothetical protein
MKRIILDHLKRWGLVWIAIGIGNCFIAGSFLDDSLAINPLSFQIVFFIGAWELNYDLMRGNGRVLTTLPVTARQIGQAWWIFSVALPSLLLTATSGLALHFHSTGAAKGFPMNELVVTAITDTLFLGSIFYLFIGSLPGRPQNAVAWVRMAFVFGFIIGMLFVKPALTHLKESSLCWRRQP